LRYGSTIRGQTTLSISLGAIHEILPMNPPTFAVFMSMSRIFINNPGVKRELAGSSPDYNSPPQSVEKILLDA
jgi:hypothetical protein